MLYFCETMLDINDMTCPAALPLVYVSFADLCPAYHEPLPLFSLRLIASHSDFSGVTVMPYFRLTMLGINDMTCPAALPLDYLSYSDCDLTKHSIS